MIKASAKEQNTSENTQKYVRKYTKICTIENKIAYVFTASVLTYDMLCCAVLCCAVLYCTVLCYSIAITDNRMRPQALQTNPQILKVPLHSLF